MSSLANQLQKIASLDAARLTSRHGAPVSKSYLFPPKTAATHDLDAIYSLAQSGFEEILALDPAMDEFEEPLFSEGAKRTDRMMLNAEENRQLDQILDKCLRRLGRWIGIMAGGKCLEWLVRRFRVHEMNAETVLQVFLPYHDSPNFARMLAILSIPQTSVYHAPFAPLIKNAQPLKRAYIATAISPSRDRSLRLLRDVAGMVQAALLEKTVHRAMLGFWSATIVEMLENLRSTNQALSDGTVKTLLEAFVGILSSHAGGEDVNAAVYPPLLLLSRSVRLADEPFKAVLEALLVTASGANPSHRILTLLVLLNERPGWQGGLGQAAGRKLSKIERLGEILAAVLTKYGFEQAILVVVEAMAASLKGNVRHLLLLAQYPDLPSAIVAELAKNILTAGSRSESDQQQAKELVDVLAERHPKVVDQTIREMSALGLVDSALLGDSLKSMPLVEIFSADISSRVQAVNDTYQLLDTASSSSEDPAATNADMIEALLARLGDSEQSVVDAVYAHKTRLVKLITVGQFVSAVCASFSPKSANRLKHIDFLFNSLLPARAGSDHESAVFNDLLFPFLLRTRSDGGDALSSEELSVLSASASLKPGLLARVSNALRKSGSIPSDNSAAVNKIVIEALASAFIDSGPTEAETSFLLGQLDSATLSSRLLSQLVLAAILQGLKGEKRLLLAVQVLQTIKLPIGTHRPDSELPLNASASVLAMSSKHDDSRATAHAISWTLFEATALVVRPTNVTALDVSPPRGEDLFSSYAALLYDWINNTLFPKRLAKVLLSHLFTSLADDSLLFLANAWIASKSAVIKQAALRHAAAFIQASVDMDMDFQTIIPAVLLAIQDSDKQVRQEAVALLAKFPKQPGESIYALDSVYGTRSMHIQLLKQWDLKQYVTMLVDVSDELVLDRNRLNSLYASKLSAQESKSKKEVTRHRRAVVSWLLSHALAWQNLTARMAILRSLTALHDSAVFRGCLPLLRELIKPASEEAQWLSKLGEKDRMTYLDLLTSFIVPAPLAAHVDSEGEGWEFLLAALKAKSNEKLRFLVLQRVSAGVFDILPPPRKITYIMTLISSSFTLNDAPPPVKILAALKLGPEELAGALSQVGDRLEVHTARKKAKGDEGVTAQVEAAVRELTVLIDSRDWPAIAPNAQLIATLMTTLSNLLAKKQSIKEGIDYLEQELLAAVVSQLSKTTNAEELRKAHVGIEVIIKVIRASTNPRTSERALLVASELARLMPDTVLHNAMPIFTFMGASDFQRDDAYTFGVVEKTVASIVPVITKSLREKAATPLELYNESARFLGIFTDMVGRLPRHRTLPFFVHLVKSLGPENYLPPVLMLLVERGTRGKASSSQALELPLSLALAASGATRASSISEIVQEVLRSLDDTSSAEKTAFLSQHVDEDEPMEQPLRHISPLLSLVVGICKQLSGKAYPQASIQDAVTRLIEICAKVSSKAFADSGLGLEKPARRALNAAMQLLAAGNFFEIVVEMLSGEVEQTRRLALEVLVERLPLVKADVRSNSSALTVKVIQQSAQLLASSTCGASAVSALRAFALSASGPEDAALAHAVPSVVEAARSARKQSSLISLLVLLQRLIRHLKSRMIPYIQSIIDASLHIIGQAEGSVELSKEVFALLGAVTETIPDFVSGKQLILLLSTSVSYRSQDETVSSTLVNTIAKKIPTKTLFPVLMDLWKELPRSNANAMEGFFDLLRLTLKHAERSIIPGMLKPIFAFFLDVFDLRHRLRDQAIPEGTTDRIEQSAISSFLELVIKLDEKSFKPLFIRLYDWAVVDLAEAPSASARGKIQEQTRLVERQVVLLQVMYGLLHRFREILSPYMGTLMPYLSELLPAYAAGERTEEGLWRHALSVLGKSFEVDAGAYYTDKILLALVPSMVAQLSMPTPAIQATLNQTDSPLATTLAALAKSTTSENVLKALNTALCMKTRDDEVRVRLGALVCLDAVWQAQMEEMMTFVPETVSEFLAELLEDENGDVERLARGVLAKIEGMTGSLKEYLE